MARHTYTHYFVVYDWLTGMLSSNRSDGYLTDDAGNRVPAFDQNGVETPLRTGPAGVLEPFTADISHGTAVFGDVLSSVQSDAAMDGADAAQQAASAAVEARDFIADVTANTLEWSYVVRNTQGDLVVSQNPVSVSAGGARLRFDDLGYLHAEFLI